MAKNILPIAIQVRGTLEWKQWIVDTANERRVGIPDLFDEAIKEWAEKRKIDPPPPRVGPG